MKILGSIDVEKDVMNEYKRLYTLSKLDEHEYFQDLFIVFVNCNQGDGSDYGTKLCQKHFNKWIKSFSQKKRKIG